LFTHLIVELRYHADIAQVGPILCIWYAYGYFPMMQMTFLGIFLYFLRYFAIINLNHIKKVFARINEETYHVPRWFRVFKILSSSWFSGASLFVGFVGYIAVDTIILVSNLYVCSWVVLNVVQSIHTVILLLTYFAIIALFATDVIMNFKLIFSPRFYHYFWTRDPHIYRIQMFACCVYLLYAGATEITIISVSSVLIIWVPNFEAIAILTTISLWILLLIDVIFPLTITFKRWIYSILFYKKVVTGDLTMTILHTMETHNMLLKFAKNEFSMENLLCWDDMQIFKKTKSKKIFDNMFLKYFTDNSVMQINLPSAVVVDLKKKHKAIQGDVCEDTLLDPVERVILENLGDTISRFIFSPPYLQWRKTREAERELLDGNIDFSKGIKRQHQLILEGMLNEVRMLRSENEQQEKNLKLREDQMKQNIMDQVQVQVDKLKGEINTLSEANRKLLEENRILKNPVETNDISEENTSTKVQEAIHTENEPTIPQEITPN
jgi:hypothetical protein